MKFRFSYLFKSTFFALATVALFTQCKGEASATSNTASSENVNNGTITYKVAYVDMDSLLMNYDYWNDINEAMMKKQEDMTVTINQKIRDFENDYKDFQRKIDENVFFTRERAEQEKKRLYTKQKDVESLQAKLSQEYAAEAQKNDLEIRDAINSYIQEYNKAKGYNMIFSNAGNSNFLYADKALNITKEVVAGLNAKYKTKN